MWYYMGMLNQPRFSIIIPAYNEEKVIVRTVQAILNSNYPGLDVIIVDDGSADQTYQVARENFYGDPRVRIFTKENGGKAEALNFGVLKTDAEIIVTLDADTIFLPNTIEKLVRRFVDTRVWAVAGNAKVGNRINLLTRWQALEYITSQNLDRRAFEIMNCITVVPGAVGAWRRWAIVEAGGFSGDTLAEDTDLTLQLHRHGWKVLFAPKAFADTEAPEHVSALISQRFRWSFGTLQCLWKHGEMLFNPDFGWLGWFALPSVWLFQITVVAITPILDVLVLWSLWLGRGSAIWPYFLASLLLDVVLAVIALLLAGRAAREAWKAIPMRLLYRPLLGYVVWKCLLKALAGSWVRWSKLERTAGAIQQKESASSKKS